jgi:hypothetical protein
VPNRNPHRPREPRARLWAALGLALPLAATAQQSDNVCEDQIRNFVARNFAQTVTRVDFRYEELNPSPREARILTQALAYVEECPGYHFFEVIGDDYTCERQARIGRIPNLIIYRSSGDGCGAAR